MKAVVVYESLWGNTAAVARAMAEGIGPQARALSTAEADGAELAGVDLHRGRRARARLQAADRQDARRACAPTRARRRRRPTSRTRRCARGSPRCPRGMAARAAFDTQVRGPFGSAGPEIAATLEQAGYPPLGKPVGFVVKGRYGPLRDGEVERAGEQSRGGPQLAQHRWVEPLETSGKLPRKAA